MRSAPDVWYIGGNYEKIYLSVPSFVTVYMIASNYEYSMNIL